MKGKPLPIPFWGILLAILITSSCDDYTCYNCHMLNNSFSECHYWVSNQNGDACNDLQCIENIYISMSSCFYNPDGVDGENCDAIYDDSLTTITQNIRATTNCTDNSEEAIVNWTFHDSMYHAHCTFDGCRLDEVAKACELTVPCSGNIVTTDNRGPGSHCNGCN